MPYTPGFGSDIQLTEPPAAVLPGATPQWNAYRDSLRQSAMRDWAQALDNALRGVEQHYASRGLSTSGIREGAIGSTARENANAMGSALLGIDQRVLSWMMQQQQQEQAYQRQQQAVAQARADRQKQLEEWRAYQQKMLQRREEQAAQQRLYEGSMADRMAMQQALQSGNGFGNAGPNGLEQMSREFNDYFGPGRREDAERAALAQAWNRSGHGQASHRGAWDATGSSLGQFTNDAINLYAGEPNVDVSGDYSNYYGTGLY